MKGPFALVVLLCGVLAASTAMAAASADDVAIVARTLGFMEKPLTGVVRVGIVYAPGTPQSSQDAAALQKIMETGVKVGGLSLTPVMVPVDGVAQANVDLLFLADGIGARGPEVGAAARARQIPCVTLDIPQVRNGDCAIGVRSEPRVEILVNQEAASRSGVGFAGAFKMLITEF
jgi:ABC-type uncharacterized transport system substrate-binding protein